jgi:hypothetical protein
MIERNIANKLSLLLIVRDWLGFLPY